MDRIIVKGYILVPTPDLQAVLDALPTHIALTRKEPGCIRFQVSQDAADVNKFHVYEEFVDSEAFLTHQARVGSSHWGDISQNVERYYQFINGTVNL